MKTILLILALAAARIASAQTVYLKDGTVIISHGVRRDGETIIATVDIPPQAPGQPSTKGDFGYPVANIAKIDFPEPAQLKLAADLVNQGKIDDGLAQLKAVLDYYDAIGDVPGSWWGAAQLLQIQILERAGRQQDAEQLAQDMAKNAVDPDNARAAQIYLAAGIAQSGDSTKAMEVDDNVLKYSARRYAQAAAAVNEGQVQIGRGDWRAALLSLLQVSVFYPDQDILMPDVLLGSAKAYTGLHDFTRAKAALADLTRQYPATPEAGQVNAELAKLTRLEKNDPAATTP